MKLTKFSTAKPIALACASLLWLSVARATPLTQVTLDTSGYPGQSGQLAYDFVDGGPPSNTITISNFITDGTLGSQTPTGNETGNLPGAVTLGDAQFFNELLANITLGQSLTFDFQTTNLPPSAGSLPDEFSFFLLSSANGQPAFATTDPTGAGALFRIDLTGGAAPSVAVYTDLITLGPPTITPTPEAATLLLVGSALLFFGVTRRRRGSLRKLVPSTAMAALAIASVHPLKAQTQYIPDTNVQATLSGLRLNRATHTYDATVSITNTSSQTVQGPFYLGIIGITNPQVTINGPSGILPNGSPYITLPGLPSMAPGQTVSSAAVLAFANPQTDAFNVTVQVYDSVSAPPTATLKCPTIAPIVNGAPGPAWYTPPIDSLGRLAACSPAPGTTFGIGNTTVSCTSTGGSSPPASCSFDYEIQPVIQIGGTITINYPVPTPAPPVPAGPQPADLAMVPCEALVPNYVPNLPPGDFIIEPFEPCGTPPLGANNFTVVNYGPNAAQNISVTVTIPPGVTGFAVKFSKAAACSPLVKYTVVENILGVQYPALAQKLTCNFADLEVMDTINATTGVDVPGSSSGTTVPTLYAQVEPDPVHNTDPNSSNNSIGLGTYTGFQSITAPAIKTQTDCSYSHDIGFAILLDTCGVPQYVTTIVTGAVLGATTLIVGGGIAWIDASVAIESTVFNADAGTAVGFLTR